MERKESDYHFNGAIIREGITETARFWNKEDSKSYMRHPRYSYVRIYTHTYTHKCDRDTNSVDKKETQYIN